MSHWSQNFVRLAQPWKAFLWRRNGGRWCLRLGVCLSVHDGLVIASPTPDYGQRNEYFGFLFFVCFVFLIRETLFMWQIIFTTQIFEMRCLILIANGHALQLLHYQFHVKNLNAFLRYESFYVNFKIHCLWHIWVIKPCSDSGLNIRFFLNRHHLAWSVNRGSCCSSRQIKSVLYSPVFEQCVYPYLCSASALLLEQADSWHPWLVMGDTCRFAFYDGPWICLRSGASYEKTLLRVM